MVIFSTSLCPCKIVDMSRIKVRKPEKNVACFKGYQ